MRATVILCCLGLLAAGGTETWAGEAPGKRASKKARKSGEPPGDPAPAPRAVAKTEGVEIHYVQLALQGSRRSVRREREILFSLEAEFRSKVAVAYRRAVLTPGTYRLTVEAAKGEEPHLVFRPKPPARKGGRGNRRGSPRDGGGVGSEKVNKSEGPRKQATQENRDAKGRVLLRVPLRERDSQEKTERLEIELKRAAKGKRIQVAIGVGLSRRIANLRVPRAETDKDSEIRG